MLIRENNIRGKNFSEFLDLLAQFKSGDVDGIRVRVGRLQVRIPEKNYCTLNMLISSTILFRDQ